MRKGIILFIPQLFYLSCSMLVLDSPDFTESRGADGTDMAGVRVYVEESRLAGLTPYLNQYSSDLDEEDKQAVIIPWNGTGNELRSDLQSYEGGGWTAFFIGDIPYVNYELTGPYEVFPTDLYFSSPGTIWEDNDGNGIFDSHGETGITIPVSRLTGTDSDLEGYFDKLHRYRRGTLTFDDRGSLFKDDDWSSYLKGSQFGMDRLLPRVDIVETIPQTTHNRYTDVIDQGYKYVYQWIHANPSSLYVQEGSEYNKFRFQDINENSVDAGFINMFDCEAARFTQDNLGMAYLVNTDTVLAVMGSTKKGGNFEPLEFHRALAADRSWSVSYRHWYNTVGYRDDRWYLGMVILGDPLLKLGSTPSRAGTGDFNTLIPPSETDREHYFSLFENFSQQK